MKLWNGHKLNKEIEDFTVGEDYIFDQKLVKYDCLASIAHAKMLGKIGILKGEEVEKIVRELNNIIELDKEGKFKIKKEDEDCHTAIENYLTKKLGELGKKIHTGRSRNDQVLTALRLYYKDELKKVEQLSKEFIEALGKFTKKYGKIKIPGYTHYRKAMPSTIEIWAGAFLESMKDNLKMLKSVFELIDQSPLGAGAGYGVPLALDREYTAKLIGFRKVQKNPLYTQNSRGKFEGTIIHTLSQITYDLNKIAADLIIFTMSEFGYFELPNEFCTGSSIMPHKKNPDVLEILRGKHPVICSLEFQVKGITANLMSSYSRVLQLTKDPTIRAFELVKECLTIAKLLFKNLKVNKERCESALTEEIFATEEVFKLVKKGASFREAYKIISKKYEKK
jgi:argininosuccinate lyase